VPLVGEGIAAGVAEHARVSFRLDSTFARLKALSERPTPFTPSNFSDG
jgi:hypothetical protein